MFGFIKRIFGKTSEVQFNADPFSREQALPAAAPPPPAPPVRVAPPTVLQRDEIIDAKTRICGYRFCARRPDSAQQPDAPSTLEVLSANNVAAFAERRMALIPIGHRDWSELDYRPLIGPNTVFLLELPSAGPDSLAWIEAAASMRAAGARVAVPGKVLAGSRELIAGNADFLVIDFSAYSLPNLERAITALKAEQPKLGIIAENVGRWAEYRYCIAHGIAHCMGAFSTSQDEEHQSGEIGQSRLVLIEMLNHLRRDSDLADIAEVAKRDPGVVVKLIAMANSPMLGLAQAVTSVDQAIMVLGREQLYRWLAIGMFRVSPTSPRDEVLLELALARGRFLEIVGQSRHSKAECDELFLLGLLSLLDCLLGVPMATVVERIHLSPQLREVLLESGGPLARHLMLAIAVEKGRIEYVARLAEQLALPLADIESASVEAIGWAEEAVRLTA